MLLHQAEREAEGAAAPLRARAAGGARGRRGRAAPAARRRSPSCSWWPRARDPAAAIEHFLAYPMLATVLERELDHCAARLAGGLRVELTVHRRGARPTPPRCEPRSPRAAARPTSRSLELRLARRHAAARAAAARQGRGRPLPPPGPALHPARAARGRGRDRGRRRRRRLPATSSPRRTSRASSTATPSTPTASTPSRRWRGRPRRWACSTSPSPTTPPPRTTRAACTLDRLKRQWDEIARAQEKVKVRLLRGTESRHPGRRLARLPGRGPRAARRRHRQRPQPPQAWTPTR